MAIKEEHYRGGDIFPGHMNKNSPDGKAMCGDGGLEK